jgi:hypothetical protein
MYLYYMIVFDNLNKLSQFHKRKYHILTDDPIHFASYRRVTEQKQLYDFNEIGLKLLIFKVPLGRNSIVNNTNKTPQN